MSFTNSSTAGASASSKSAKSANSGNSTKTSSELSVLDPAISSLRSRISGLGAALFDLEQNPALPLASGANYTGLTAKIAGEIKVALADLWLGYPKLVAEMEAVETARGTSDSLRSHDREALRLLVVEGRTSLAGNTLEQEHDRLNNLLVVARKHLDVIDDGFATCATALSELEALARSAMTSAEQTGERANEVSRITKQLNDQRANAAADPLGWQGASATAEIGTQLRAIASELGVVLQTQDRLDELVVEGAKRLDTLRLLIANGIAAAAKAKSRMADTDTLPAPLRISVLDGVEGLRHRLALVGAALDADPRKARQLWTLWDRDMSATQANATSVLQCNAQPIAERDSLRGRLDGFEVKAAAAGVVENPTLVQLHREATALLTTPPVSLRACEIAVGAYGQAVSATIAERSGTNGTPVEAGGPHLRFASSPTRGFTSDRRAGSGTPSTETATGPSTIASMKVNS
jgi:phage FluMu protein gp41